MTEIRVFSTIGMRTVLEELVPGFELAHDCTVARVYDSSVAAMKRIAAGESGDVAVFTAGAIDDLIAQGKMLARTDLARSFVGIAVRRGAPKPDIATPDTFKAAMLVAKSVAHSKTGASGLYFVSLMERLGIAGVIKPKAVVIDGIVGKPAASGGAEVAGQQVGEPMQGGGSGDVGW